MGARKGHWNYRLIKWLLVVGLLATVVLLAACGSGTAPPLAQAKIAFISDRDGNFEIYVMDADGSNPTNLTNNPGRDSFPAWSPDGSKIAFGSDRDGNMEIYVMDIENNLGGGIDRNIGSYELSSAIEAEPPPVATDAIEDRAAESIEPPSTQDEETDGVYRFGGVTPDSADEATDEDISFDDIVGISPAGASESPEAESPKADNATDPAADNDNNGDRNGIGDGDDGSGGTETDHGGPKDPDPDETNR